MTPLLIGTVTRRTGTSGGSTKDGRAVEGRFTKNDRLETNYAKPASVRI